MAPSSSSSVLIMVMIFLLLGGMGNNYWVEAAREFKVGDHLGWHEPDANDIAFYVRWAERNRFQIGDSLVFEYQNDSVLIVDKWHYFHCDPNEPITSLDDGNSTVVLDRSGNFYFISGTQEHCHAGQKLIVDVMAPHQIPTYIAPSSISIAPSQDDGDFSSQIAPSPNSHYHSKASISIVIGSAFVAVLATFVVVLLLAP